MFINVLGQHVSILIESSSGPTKKGDSIRMEKFCPNTLINIIKVCCVSLTHHCIFIYVLNTLGRQALNLVYVLTVTVIF